MQMTVIQCDACRSQSQTTEEGWGKLSMSLSSHDAIAIDVCPACHEKASLFLTRLMTAQPLGSLTLQTLAAIERLHILEVMEHTGGKKSTAAKILGIERSTLDRKLRLYEISRKV